MSAIEFVDILRAIRGQEAEDFPGSFILKFLDRWLKESADLDLWDKIADDAEKLTLARVLVFHFIVRIACDGLELYSPKFGLSAATDRLERRQKEISNFKNLAASASALAQHYRGLSEFFDVDKSLQERVALYEKEMKTFQNEATILELDLEI